ncbi:hypothetical protein [Allosphingosinicella sp.]|uniref:hypothetical protein n=1 Tax=Allosphingosinicella sp. TaxID=2823234 RepID=UPI00378349FB
MINNDARSYASLSSGLLARKGAARPAMKPQGYGQSHGFDDLGWNDMGHQVPPPIEEHEDDLPEHVPSSISALTPAPKLAREDAQAEEPEVVAQQRAIAESFPEAEVEAETETEIEAEAEAPIELPRVKPRAHVVPLPKRPLAKAKADGGKKAAFTLRLDGERHLRLRLATAVTGQSAQQIVTSALDAMLASIPEVEALAERAVSAKANRN